MSTGDRRKKKTGQKNPATGQEKLTARQKKFCLEYAKSGNATQAMLASGYSASMAGKQSASLIVKPSVQAELQRLATKTEDKAICDIIERKRILSQIARAEFTDYAECSKDGAWVSAGKESPNRQAIKKFTSRTEYNKDGSAECVTTSIELADKAVAIDILNKMEGAYTQKMEVTGPGGGPVLFVNTPAPIGTIEEWERQCREARKNRPGHKDP